MNLLWVLHFAAVAFMTGLIWLIQLVHYPLMGLIQGDQFKVYHASHSLRITWIVGPVMLIELITAILLVLQQGPSNRLWTGVCLGLSVFVFAVTAFLSVPAHGILAQGFDNAAHLRLVSTNWLRTLAWSAHLIVCVWLFSTQSILD